MKGLSVLGATIFILSLTESCCYISNEKNAKQNFQRSSAIFKLKARKQPELFEIIATTDKSGIQKKLARVIGYVLGAGSLGLYTPIVYDLLRKRSSTGMSIATWVYNLLGFTAGLVYAIKKQFPFSTYVDSLALWTQSLLILFLTCFFSNKLNEFVVGILAYGIIVGSLLSLPCPPQFLGAIQVGASASSNYAQIPQIVMNFKLQSASYNIVSAFLATIGNLARVFTTIQLTKDPLIGIGHTLGFLTNGFLLSQIVYYNRMIPK